MTVGAHSAQLGLGPYFVFDFYRFPWLQSVRLTHDFLWGCSRAQRHLSSLLPSLRFADTERT